MKRSEREAIYSRNLKDKTIVITGASSGVGRAAALEFARYGTKLVLAARRQEALAEVVAQCRELGSVAIGVPVDVTDDEAMKSLAKTGVDFSGHIDVWVNNAGVLAAGEFTETPIEIHDRIIQVNLMGYLHGAHAVVPYFKQQQYGVLINNISIGGWIPVPYGVGYSASKYGLRGFSEALRGELVKYPDIHVCEMYPAFLDTPGIQHAANYTGRTIKPAPPVYDPQGVARAMVLLAQHPKKSVMVHSASAFLRIAHSLLPGVTRYITAKVIETYLGKAEPMSVTSGNLFESSDYGTSIHGGWNSQADAEIRKKAFIRSLAVAGAVAGLLFWGKKKLFEKHEGAQVGDLRSA